MCRLSSASARFSAGIRRSSRNLRRLPWILDFASRLRPRQHRCVWVRHPAPRSLNAIICTARDWPTLPPERVYQLWAVAGGQAIGPGHRYIAIAMCRGRTIRGRTIVRRRHRWNRLIDRPGDSLRGSRVIGAVGRRESDHDRVYAGCRGRYCRTVVGVAQRPVIGGQVIGTQGTPVEVLGRRIDVRYFQNLWDVRNALTEEAHTSPSDRP